MSIHLDNKGAIQHLLLFEDQQISNDSWEQIVQLERIRELRFVNCQMETVPSSIAQLKNLTILEFSQTPIKTLPREISELISLEELHIVQTMVEYLPPGLSRLPKLKILNVLSSKKIVESTLNPFRGKENFVLIT